ncbi:MAG TPA: hypothetical protein IGS40_05495 [Trichormus sp. M33_DOE_039]|nr:hypothetical protein [Trichormus sp. M33_DOE_039]
MSKLPFCPFSLRHGVVGKISISWQSCISNPEDESTSYTLAFGYFSLYPDSIGCGKTDKQAIKTQNFGFYLIVYLLWSEFTGKSVTNLRKMETLHKLSSFAS